MLFRQTDTFGNQGVAGDRHGLPPHAELSALRAVCEGIDTRAAVERHGPICSSMARAVIGRVQRHLQRETLERRRPDLAEAFAAASAGQHKNNAPAIFAALNELKASPKRTPLIGDSVEDWTRPA